MNDRGEADPTAPQLARPDQRMEATFVLPPHPTVLAVDELLAQCEQRFQRRSGPGGQHRNKTSSGVFLTYRPGNATRANANTDNTPPEVTAEATERRSQADNRAVAMKRLRYQLAIELRTPSIFDHASDAPAVESEAKIRDKYRGGNLKLNEENHAKPALVAMLLNDLHAAGGQPSLVATQWKVSTSALVQLLKSHPAAFAWTNRCRQHHGRRDLK